MVDSVIWFALSSLYDQSANTSKDDQCSSELKIAFFVPLQLCTDHSFLYFPVSLFYLYRLCEWKKCSREVNARLTITHSVFILGSLVCDGQCLLWTSQRRRHVGTGNTGRSGAQLDLAESRYLSIK